VSKARFWTHSSNPPNVGREMYPRPVISFIDVEEELFELPQKVCLLLRTMVIASSNMVSPGTCNLQQGSTDDCSRDKYGYEKH